MVTDDDERGLAVSMFLMKSTTPGSFLCFSGRTPEYFDVTIETPNLTATRKVFICDYASESGFVDYFQHIARHARPWIGEDVWEAPDGDMRLRATCDTLGHVRFEIALSDHVLDWSLVCSLMFDFGMLPRHADDAERFMASSLSR